MREGFKIAATTLALSMLAVCTGLLIVNSVSRLPQDVQAPAGQKEPGYAKDHPAGKIPTVEDFSSWDVQHKSQYCSQNVLEKTTVRWAQDYLCGAKYTDKEAALSSVRIVYLTVALVGVGFAQIWIYYRQTKIMSGQQEIMASQRDVSLATQRAWVGATVKIAGPIKVAAEHCVCSFVLELFNTGTLPGNIERPWIAGFPWDMNQATSQGPRVTNTMKHQAAAPLQRHGVIFPQQSINHSFQIEIRKSHIEAATNTMMGFVPVVRGIVRYDYNGSPQLHYTTFHVHIVRTPDPTVPSDWHTIPTDDGITIPARDLLVTPHMGETEAT